MAPARAGSWSAMPTYLVERYLPGRDRAWLEAALARLPSRRDGVAYLGSTYVPSDESCFCRFEAETADDVRDANEVAGVPFARIVVAGGARRRPTGSRTRRRSIMKRSVDPAPRVAAAGIVASASSAHESGGRATPPDGALHVTKECSQYDGAVGVVLHDQVVEHRRRSGPA